MAKLIISVTTLLSLLAGSALAGNCNQFFRQRVAHHGRVQAVAVVPHVYYSAGSDIVNEAIVRKAIRAEAPALVAQLRQELSAPQTQHVAATGILSAKCAKCHNGPDSQGGDKFDLQAGRTDAAVTRTMEMLTSKTAAPDAMKGVINGMKPEEFGPLMDAMLALPRVAAPGTLE
jgi:cytochrome c553